MILKMNDCNSIALTDPSNSLLNKNAKSLEAVQMMQSKVLLRPEMQSMKGRNIVPKFASEQGINTRLSNSILGRERRIGTRHLDRRH
jgi:hypothetical protein